MTKHCALVLTLVLVAICGIASAHPHFGKSVSAKVGDNELTVNFTTYPFSESHLSEVQPGFVFHCGRGRLTLTAAVSSGANAIPAGDYLIRALADSVDQWTLVLIPAASAQGATADVASGIRLDSTTVTGLPVNHHLNLDLHSGHGETDGKLILSVEFGDRKVEGVLSLGQ